MAYIETRELSFWGLETMVSCRHAAPQYHADDVWAMIPGLKVLTVN